MFSKRLLWMFSRMTKISCFVGASCHHFDEKQKHFIRSPAAFKKVKRNYTLALVWMIGIIGILIKLYLARNVAGLNATLAHFLNGTAAIIVFTLCRFYEDDMGRHLNGSFLFVRNIQGIH